MPKTLFKVNLKKPMAEQDLVGHNRWHPDIPSVVAVNPGEVFRIECKDWTDGQIQNNDSPDDVRDVELSIVPLIFTMRKHLMGTSRACSWLQERAPRRSPSPRCDAQSYVPSRA